MSDTAPLDGSDCGLFESAMVLLGRRWAGLVVRALLPGPLRFADLRRSIPGITDAMLSARLRELCAAGVAVRTVTDSRPVQVSYTLTDAGRDLAPVLDQVELFAQRHPLVVRGIGG